MFNDLECRIYRDPVFNGINMMLYTRHADGTVYTVKPLLLELERHDDGAPAEPTIKLTGPSAEAFLKSLADELDRQGVKTDSDAKLSGTLEATKAHLDDMRNLTYMLMSPSSFEGDQHAD